MFRGSPPATAGCDPRLLSVSPPGWAAGWPLLFFDRAFVFGDDLLFEFVGHLGVMAEALGVQAASAGERTEHAGILIKLLLGHLRFHDGLAIGAVGAADVPATTGEIPHHAA